MKLYTPLLLPILLAVYILILVAIIHPKKQAESVSLPAQLALINETRESNKLPKLKQRTNLNQSAADKCQHMVVHNYWAHSGGGTTWDSFIDEYNKKGEILASDFKDTASQHTAWINSPHHREVIVDEFKYFGSATCEYTDGKNLTVVHFGA